jgi:hypothetical protein
MNSESVIYSLFLFVYLYHYGPPRVVKIFFYKILFNFSKLVNEIDSIFLLKNTSENIIENTSENTFDNNKIQTRYEDKYLEEIRKMNKDFIFSEKEEILMEEKCKYYYESIFENYTNEINKINREIIENKEILQNIESEEYVIESDTEDEEYEELLRESYYLRKEERMENINKEIEDLESRKRLLMSEFKKLESQEKQTELLKQSEEKSAEFIIKKHLERLNNCFVLEYTPHGNVLMIYDSDRGSFKYYSDNTIPYRYLEPVARKYVKQFNCRPIFVDMEYELKLAEEKWEKERAEKEEREQKKKTEEDVTRKEPQKKNIFAKFKSYNKEAASGKVNTGAPPKNSIPNNKLTKDQEKEKILIKEKANRYTYEGKIANFCFLKKVDKKIINKKYGLSFADFKKMNPK